MATERLIPTPSGDLEDITKIRTVMAHRFREQQPQMNQPSSDTLPGEGSGDQ